MRVGYAPVSKGEQNLDLQLDAFKLAGCDRVFTDHLTGVREDRPGLLEALEFVRPGDVLVVWRLDRLGRTLKYLIALMNQLSAKGIGFQSLQEQIDTTTSGGMSQSLCLLLGSATVAVPPAGPVASGTPPPTQALQGVEDPEQQEHAEGQIGIDQTRLRHHTATSLLAVHPRGGGKVDVRYATAPCPSSTWPGLSRPEAQE
jgi:hypothetical protein